MIVHSLVKIVFDVKMFPLTPWPKVWWVNIRRVKTGNRHDWCKHFLIRNNSICSRHRLFWLMECTSSYYFVILLHWRIIVAILYRFKNGNDYLPFNFVQSWSARYLMWLNELCHFCFFALLLLLFSVGHIGSLK